MLARWNCDIKGARIAYGRFRAETAAGGFDFSAEIDDIAVGACYISTLELGYKRCPNRVRRVGDSGRSRTATSSDLAGAVFDEDRAAGRPNEVPWVSKRPADGVFLFCCGRSWSDAAVRSTQQPALREEDAVSPRAHCRQHKLFAWLASSSVN